MKYPFGLLRYVIPCKGCGKQNTTDGVWCKNCAPPIGKGGEEEKEEQVRKVELNKLRGGGGDEVRRGRRGREDRAWEKCCTKSMSERHKKPSNRRFAPRHSPIILTSFAIPLRLILDYILEP